MRSCLPVAVACLLAGMVAGCGGSRATEKAKSTSAGWVMTDLGTLGGSYSFATDINERDQVVGISRTATGELHVFLLQSGKMTDLGSATSGLSSPMINERGQVVWNTEMGDGTLWSAGASRQLGFTVQAINNRDQIVGWSLTSGEDRAVLWEKGRARDIGGFTPFAINDRGDVVGDIDPLTSANSRAVLWRNGTMRALSALPGYEDTHVVAINGTDDVLAVCGDRSRDTFIPCLWREGEMRDAGWSGRWRGRPVALNDRGQVVGQRQVHSGEAAFLWTNGKLTDLGPLGPRGWVAAINNAGQVVGTALTGPRKHAFVWQNGVTTDLGRKGPHQRSVALALNNKGQVVGESEIGKPSLPGNKPPHHAVIWTRKPS